MILSGLQELSIKVVSVKCVTAALTRGSPGSSDTVVVCISSVCVLSCDSVHKVSGDD